MNKQVTDIKAEAEIVTGVASPALPAAPDQQTAEAPRQA